MKKKVSRWSVITVRCWFSSFDFRLLFMARTRLNVIYVPYVSSRHTQRPPSKEKKKPHKVKIQVPVQHALACAPASNDLRASHGGDASSKKNNKKNKYLTWTVYEKKITFFLILHAARNKIIIITLAVRTIESFPFFMDIGTNKRLVSLEKKHNLLVYIFH